MKNHLLSTALRLCCASLLLTAGAACSEAPHQAATPAASPSASPSPASATLAQQIDVQIGDAACDAPQQCRTVPVGSKACGGPSGYRAWSSKNSDGSKLTALTVQQAAQQKAADSASGRLSNCSFVADPGATCNAGHCILNKSGISAQ